jgi:hypothetical protein
MWVYVKNLSGHMYLYGVRKLKLGDKHLEVTDKELSPVGSSQ